MEITHTVYCDNEDCSNYEYLCDSYSYNGDLLPTYCGVCGIEITHTAVPINP